MKTKEIALAVVGLVLTAVGLGLIAPSGAMAQFSRNEQTTACAGDALRLCASSIPSKEKIIACLAAKHERLSPGCVGVFDANMRALQRGER